MIRALRMVQSSAAVFLVEQIVRLRSVTNRAARRGWRAEPCVCCGAEEQVLNCEPCCNPPWVIGAATVCARGHNPLC